jgi:rubredoxin
MRKRPTHGTPARYKWELRHDGRACPECKEGWKDFHREYRKNRILTTQKEDDK